MRSTFEMFERFASPDFGDLPETDLSKIQELGACTSHLLWKAWVSQSYDHLLTIPCGSADRLLIEIRLDWDEVDASRSALNEAMSSLGIQEQAMIHFWGPRCSVWTSKSEFLRYWDDYWYPSDDNDIAVFPRASIRLEFVEEMVRAYEITPCRRV